VLEFLRNIKKETCVSNNSIFGIHHLILGFMLLNSNFANGKCAHSVFIFFPLAQNDPDSWVVIETTLKTTPGG